MRALKLLLAFVLVITSDTLNWPDCGGERTINLIVSIELNKYLIASENFVI
jgi:hypothetical protein